MKQNKHRPRFHPLYQVKTAILLGFIVMLFFGARGIYQWSARQDEDTLAFKMRRLTQKIWRVSALLYLEEPAYLTEKAFVAMAGVVPDTPIERYDDVLERVKEESLAEAPIPAVEAVTEKKAERKEGVAIPAPSQSLAVGKKAGPGQVRQDMPQAMGIEPDFEAAMRAFEEDDPAQQHPILLAAKNPVKGVGVFAPDLLGTPENLLLNPVEKKLVPSLEKPTQGQEKEETEQKEDRKGMVLEFSGVQRGPNMLLVGDSLMQGIGSTLAKNLTEKLGGKAILHAKVASGLARPEFFDWTSELKKNIPYGPFDFVVIFMGTNDGQTVRENGKLVPYGTKQWADVYQSRLSGLMDLACHAGKKVIWLGLPPMKNGRFQRKMRRLNQLAKQESSAHQCVQYLSLDQVIGDGKGRYIPYRTVGNRYRRIRMRDGIHLSYAGGQLVSLAIVDGLSSH